MVTAISTSITACVNTFNEFIEDVKQHHGLNELRIKGLSIDAWEDELGRLRIWAANIGAHQTGCSSLDFRLRDASNVRAQIVKLLESLLRKLQDTRVALAENENDDVEVVDELIDLGEAKTEIQELQEGLATIVDCLFQMSMLVRKPAPHDLRHGSKDAEVAAFEQYDYNYVRGKYPRADDALVKRLSNAITLRRKYLVYRERNAVKLRQGIKEFGPLVHDLQDSQEGGSVTERTEISNTVATASQPDVAFDDNASDSEVSERSYTPTPVGGGNITIPLAPKSSLGGSPFECPYCFYLITISGRRSWKKHVFQDLPPYICVTPTCLTPDKLYPTRHEWLHHSDTAHPEMNSNYNAPQSNSVQCTLCREDVERGNIYDRHLARHLEELALFILPRSDEDSDIRESNSSFGRGGSKISEDETSEMGDQPLKKTVLQNAKLTTFGGESLDDLLLASSSENLSFQTGSSSDTKREQKHEESKLLLQYETNRKVLGDRHLETLASMESLAVSYGRGKKFQEAESLLGQVVTTRASILGADHPGTLSSMTNLAHILMKQGHGVEAKELLETTLVKEEKFLGRDHPYTLRTVRVLGDVHFEGRRYRAEAQRFYERALIGYDKLYGSEHPSTLNVVQLLGKFFTGYGKLAEAGAFYQRAVPGYIKVYGLEHPSTLDIIRCFGDNLTRRGKLEESASLYKRVLDRYDKVCGSEHPFTLNIVQLLGNYLMTQGKLAEARAFYQQAFTGYVNVYGAKHPSPIDVTLCLGDISARQGELGEAEMSYKWALAESEKLYGHEHESLLKIVQLLRSNLRGQGKVLECNALHEREISLRELYTPKADRDRRSSPKRIHFRKPMIKRHSEKKHLL